MTDLLARARARFGALNGVVHAAGELAADTFTPARELSPEVCARQFGPKVHGLLRLDRLLEGEELDFVLLTSSLSTVLGGYGYAAYAGANAFLDAFAGLRTHRGGTRWLSVDWDRWMPPEGAVPGRKDDVPALAAAQGLAVIERLFDLLDVGRLVVSATPLDPRLQRWVSLKDERAPGATAVGPDPGRARPSSPEPPPQASAIERVLGEHEAVAAAAVVSRGTHGGPASLAAYVAFADGSEPTVTELRSWLKPRLPEGVTAPSFVVLDALPLAEDGGVDRARLADLERDDRAGAGDQVPPRTRTEIHVARIWQEALGLDRVSVRDNFFSLGGHSLLSVRVVSRIEKELGVSLDPRDLVFQTLEQIAAACEGGVDGVGKRA